MLHYVSTGSRSFGTHPIAPYQRAHWEFYAVIAGRIAPWFELGKAEPLQRNALWLFAPECCHGWRGEKASARVAVFHFSDVPPALKGMMGSNGCVRIPLERGDLGQLYHAAKEVLPHVWGADGLLEYYSQRLLMDLTLLMLKRKQGGIAQAEKAPLARVQAAENLFKRNLEKRLTLKDLAIQTGTTKGHLRRLFQQVHHCGPKTIMTRFQINHAVHLLKSGDLKLEAVALESGFTSLSSFCKTFKRLHGMTPNDFRQARTGVSERGSGG